VLIGFFHNFGLDLPNETGFKIHEKRVRKRGKMGDRRPKRGDGRLKKEVRGRKTNFSKVSNFGKVLNEIPIIRKTKESTPGIRSALAKKIRQGEPTYISRM
jgi:adenine specific DNA methylase Mod